LKTHTLTRYTGSVKNLLGVLPGGRKREIHVRAPGVTEFSRALMDILALVRPQLNIMDGILGMDGNGPGTSGTPHAYNLIAASADAVALDSILARAMGFPAGGVIHLAQAEARGLGNHHPDRIQVEGNLSLLNFGKLDLPKARWFLDMPSWFTAPFQDRVKLQPQIEPSKCTACGTCSKSCPADVITVEDIAIFDLSKCIGCMCCVEVCPQAALTPRPNLLARLVGV
jgi:Pyruvate/2-oxoacid:ferredoxin oxidoreductase delta subunit